MDNRNALEGKQPGSSRRTFAKIYGDHFGDETFLFLVGPGETKFHVHPKVLSTLSAPFAALMGNGMQESSEKTARLPETDPETFALLLEFAYTGKYTPRRQAGNVHSAGMPDCLDGGPHVCGYCGDDTLIDFGFSCTSDACAAAVARGYPYQFCPDCGNARPTCADSCRAPGWGRGLQMDMEFLRLEYTILGGYPTVNFTATGSLLPHVRLFVLADQYMIQQLRELCLHRLHRELCFFKLGDQAIDEVCQLLDYAASVSELDDKQCNMDSPLIKLVMGYLILEASALVRYKTFQECMKRYTDIWESISIKAITSLGDTIQQYLDG